MNDENRPSNTMKEYYYSLPAVCIGLIKQHTYILLVPDSTSFVFVARTISLALKFITKFFSSYF